MDFRHHATDVLFGALVGTVVSYFCYRQYYPSLASPNSHLPYAPRFPAPGNSGDADENDIRMEDQTTTHDIEAGGVDRHAGEDPAVPTVPGATRRVTPATITKA
jgi:diacylglycerol diphosphate phosphatase / phosphatidate phosphatase